MSYLLDTCVLSEARKPSAHAGLRGWLRQVAEERLFISTLTLGEIRKGIARLNDEERAWALQIWLEQDLVARFRGRILPVDEEVAIEWGRLSGFGEAQGRPVPVVDALLAATAICHHLTLVTRNEQDFAPFPVTVFNPWNEAGPE